MITRKEGSSENNNSWISYLGLLPASPNHTSALFSRIHSVRCAGITKPRLPHGKKRRNGRKKREVFGSTIKQLLVLGGGIKEKKENAVCDRPCTLPIFLRFVCFCALPSFVCRLYFFACPSLPMLSASSSTPSFAVINVEYSLGRPSALEARAGGHSTTQHRQTPRLRRRCYPGGERRAAVAP